MRFIKGYKSIVVLLLFCLSASAFAEPNASSKQTKTLGIREQLIQFEREIQNRLNDLLLEDGGIIDKLDNEFDDLDDKKDLLQLKHQWFLIVPGSAIIGTVIAAMGIADLYPPWTSGIASAASTFVMLAFFKGFDWYWSKTFKGDIKRATEKVQERAEKRLTEVELKVTEVREIPPQHIEKIIARANELLSMEKDLDLMRDEIFAAYQKKVSQRALVYKMTNLKWMQKLLPQRLIKALPDPAPDYLKGELKAELIRLSIAKAHARALSTLLKQVQKTIVTARAKLDYVQLANLNQTLEAGPATNAASYAASRPQTGVPAGVIGATAVPGPAAAAVPTNCASNLAKVPEP